MKAKVEALFGGALVGVICIGVLLFGLGMTAASADAWSGGGRYSEWVTSLGGGQFVAKFIFPVVGLAFVGLAISFPISLFTQRTIWPALCGFFWLLCAGSLLAFSTIRRDTFDSGKTHYSFGELSENLISIGFATGLGGFLSIAIVFLIILRFVR